MSDTKIPLFVYEGGYNPELYFTEIHGPDGYVPISQILQALNGARNTATVIDGELAQRAFEAGYNAFFAADNGYRAPELLLESALHAIVNIFVAAIAGEEMHDE